MAHPRVLWVEVWPLPITHGGVPFWPKSNTQKSENLPKIETQKSGSLPKIETEKSGNPKHQAFRLHEKTYHPD